MGVACRGRGRRGWDGALTETKIGQVFETLTQCVYIYIYTATLFYTLSVEYYSISQVKTE